MRQTTVEIWISLAERRKVGRGRGPLRSGSMAVSRRKLSISSWQLEERARVSFWTRPTMHSAGTVAREVSPKRPPLRRMSGPGTRRGLDLAAARR
jgi:hypothetical protein